MDYFKCNTGTDDLFNANGSRCICMRANYICADLVLITSTRLRSTLEYDSAALIRDLFHFVNTNAHLGQVKRY